MKVKEESEKFALKLNIQKPRSWHLVPSLHDKYVGKQWKQWQTILGGCKITADGDCGREIKRHLLLGRKVMTNLDSLLKSGNITLPTNVCIVKAMVFPVVIYVSECWTLKKAEHWKFDAAELWCWRRLLRVPWTKRISNQSILKEIIPEYSLEGFMLKLKLQYFDWRWEERRTADDEMVGWHHRHDGDEFESSLGVGDGQGSLACCIPRDCRVGHDWATEPNWTDNTKKKTEWGREATNK